MLKVNLLEQVIRMLFNKYFEYMAVHFQNILFPINIFYYENIFVW